MPETQTVPTPVQSTPELTPGQQMVAAVAAAKAAMGDNSEQTYKDVINKDQAPREAAKPEVITHTTPQPSTTVQQEVKQALDTKESPAAAAFKELKAKLAEKEKAETEWKSKYEAEIASKKTLPAEFTEKYEGKVENVLNDLISTRQSTESLQKELDTYKSKAEEADHIVNTFKVEQSEAYKSNILRPLEKATEDLNSILEVNGLSTKDITGLLNAKDSKEFRQQMKIITEDMSAIDASDLRDAVRTVVEKSAAKTKVLSEAKEARALIEAKQNETEKQTIEQMKARAGEYASAKNKSIDTYFTELAKVDPAFQSVDGKDDWNSELQTITTSAKNVDVSRLKPEQEAAMVLQALAYPRAHALVRSQADRIAQLEKTVAEYSSGVPSIGSNLDRTEDAPKEDKRTPGEQLVAAMEKAGIKTGHKNASHSAPW